MEKDRSISQKSGIITFLKEARKNRIWRYVTNVLAVLVVFVTMYMLVLPGITLTGDAVDGTAKLEITSVDYENATYNGEDYTATLTVNFSIDVSELKSNNYTASYYLPDGVSVPSGYTQGTVLDSDDGTFTYYYMQDSSGDWYVYIIYPEDSTALGGTAVSGYFSFYATIDSSYWSETSGVEVTFYDSVTLTIPDTKITYDENTTGNTDISVSKESGNYSASGNYIEYTITVSSTKGTDGVITLSDILGTLPEGLTVSNVSISEITYSDYTSGGSASSSSTTLGTASSADDVDSGTYYSSYSDTDGLTVVLPAINGTSDSTSSTTYYGGVYTITYKVAFNEITANLSSSVSNSVTAKSVSESSGDIIVDSDTTSTTVTYNWISKTGTVGEDGTITWTITVNANHNNITGFTLEDTMLAAGGIANTDITVKRTDTSNNTTSNDYQGYEFTYGNGGSVTGISFSQVNGSDNYCTYVISYSSSSGLVWGDSYQWVNNTATLSGDGISYGSSTGGVWVSGGGLSKSIDESQTLQNSDGTVNLTWTVTATIPSGGIAAGTEWYDYLTDASSYTTVEDQWFTYEQLITNFLAAYQYNLQFTYGSNGQTVSLNTSNGDYTIYVYDRTDGEWYDLDTVYPNGASSSTYSSHKFTAFKIVFNNAVTGMTANGTITFTYSSTADRSAIDNGTSSSLTYKNTTQAGDLSKSVEHTEYASVLKMDVNEKTGTTTTTTNNNTIAWKVRIYIPEDYDTTSYTVTDTLPAGITLNTVYLSEWMNYAMTYDSSAGTLTGTLSSTTVTGTVTTDSNGQQVVTITLPAGAYANSKGGFVWIYYLCDLNATIADGESSVTISSLTNTVKVTNSSSSEYGSDEQTQDITYSKSTSSSDNISKSGSWDCTNAQYDYSVVINPSAKDLLDGADTLTFTDELSAYMDASWGQYASIVPSSVEFYQLTLLTETGTANEYTYTDSSGNTVTVTYDSSSSSFYVYDDAVYYKESIDISWTYSATNLSKGWNYYTITATIPDEMAILVQYTYNLTGIYEGEIPTTSEQTVTIKVFNTASIEGASNTSITYTGEGSYYDMGFSAGSIGATLYKVDSTNYGITLSDATFAIYKYNSSTEEFVDTGLTVKTGSNGAVSIVPKTLGDYYAPNTAYYLVETVAPDGYELDSETKYYFYWTDSDTTTYPEAYPDGFTSDSMSDGTVYDLSQMTHAIYAENDAKNYVEVKKVWVDQNGDAITDDLPESVTVALYYYVSDSEEADEAIKSASDGTLIVDGIELNAENNWTQTISEYTDNGVTCLLKTYDSTTEKYYHYYFVETKVGDTEVGNLGSSYALSYSTSDGYTGCNVVNADTKNGGTVTVTNTVARTYTSISASKLWSYGTSSTKTVPESAKEEVTLALLRVSSADTTTVETVDTVTLDGDIDDVEATAWAVAWNDLLYSYNLPDGTAVTYTYYIAELCNDGDIVITYSGTDSTSSVSYTDSTGSGTASSTYTAYEITISDAAEGGTVAITNTIPTPDAKSLSATKVWQNYDGTQMDTPTDASVTLQVYVTNGVTGGAAGGVFSDDGSVYTDGSSVANYGGYTVTLNYASGSVTATTTDGIGNSVTLSSGDSCSFTDSNGETITVGFDGTNVTWSGMYGGYDYYIVETAATVDGSSVLDTTSTDGYTSYYSVDGTTTVSEDASDCAGEADITDGNLDTVLTVVNRANSSTTAVSVNKVFTGGTTEADAIYFQIWRVAEVTTMDSAGNVTTTNSSAQVTETSSLSSGEYITDNSVFYYVLSGNNSWKLTIDDLPNGSRIVQSDGSVIETVYSYYVVETGASTSSSQDTYTTLDSYKMSYSSSSESITQDVDGDGTDEIAYKVDDSGSMTITNADANAILALEKEWEYEDGEEAANTEDATAEFTLWREASYTVYTGMYYTVNVYYGDGSDKVLKASKKVLAGAGVTITSSSSMTGYYVNRSNSTILQNWSSADTIAIDGSYVSGELVVYCFGSDGDYTITYDGESTDTGVSQKTAIEAIETVTLKNENAWSYNWQLATNGTITVGSSTYDCTYTYYLTENSASYGSQSLSDMVVSLVDSNGNTLSAENVTDSNGTTVENAYPVTLGTTLTTVTATNRVKEETTSVSVTKQWNSSIQEASVTFTLVQLLVNPDSQADDDKWVTDGSGNVVENASGTSLDYTKTISVTNSTSSTATWDELPKTVTYNGSTYVCAYYIAETTVTNAADGTGTDITGNYEPAYSSSSSYTDSNGTVYYLATSDTPLTVTNTKKDSVTLPMTGGLGNKSMTALLGSSAVLLALAFIIARRRKMGGGQLE